MACIDIGKAARKIIVIIHDQNTFDEPLVIFLISPFDHHAPYASLAAILIPHAPFFTFHLSFPFLYHQ
jgi:hypothetical protein